MIQYHSMRRLRSPLVVAMAVAVLGVLGMLLVDHGPWNKPHLQTAEVHYPSTKAAANAVGATVTPTTPKPAIEPDVPGPKPAQPANPVSQ
jgi:hypothetical protein